MSDGSDADKSDDLSRENRAVVCGGVTVNSEVINSCFSLDRERQQWVIEPYMRDERAYAAGEQPYFYLVIHVLRNKTVALPRHCCFLTLLC